MTWFMSFTFLQCSFSQERHHRSLRKWTSRLQDCNLCRYCNSCLLRKYNSDFLWTIMQLWGWRKVVFFHTVHILWFYMIQSRVITF